MITNLRLDPFERTGITGSLRVLRLVQVPVLALRVRAGGGGKFGETFIDFPPLQKPASFNLDAIKEQVKAAMAAHHAA